MMSFNQSISQPTNQPTNQSINQPISRSVNQSINQAISRSINQPINQPTNRPIHATPHLVVGHKVLHARLERKGVLPLPETNAQEGVARPLRPAAAIADRGVDHLPSS